jgi:type I restriction enzyme M protein
VIRFSSPYERTEITLFIDVRRLGRRISRTQIELSVEDIQRITRTYHAWRGLPDAGACEDEAGFCKSATIDEIEAKSSF